jgi:hypothetical protein
VLERAASTSRVAARGHRVDQLVDAEVLDAPGREDVSRVDRPFPTSPDLPVAGGGE